MNRLLANSVMRRYAVTGGNVLPSPELSAAAVFTFRPLDQAVTARDHDFGSFQWRRMMSCGAEPTAKAPSVKQADAKKDDGDQVVPSSYWGISRNKVTREDGTEWPWNCFMPWDTYESNLSIDLSKHHVPKNFVDKFALRTVKLLRVPTDIFFRDIHFQGKELRDAPAPFGYN